MPLPRLALLLVVVGAVALAPAVGAADPTKPRVLVLTDISNEPGDEQSLVRFLVYANEYDIEGLVATTSTWLKQGPREDLIRRHLAAYAEARPNLRQHAPGVPPAEQLAAVTKTGQPGYGMAFVGESKGTAGSQLILAALTRPDPRPLWVTVWAAPTRSRRRSPICAPRTRPRTWRQPWQNCASTPSRTRMMPARGSAANFPRSSTSSPRARRTTGNTR